MIEKISYEEVNTIAQTLSTGAKRMEQILNETTQQMETVNTDATLKSNAAAELYNKYKTLSAKFSNFYEAVESYSKFLVQTVETYQAADQTIQNKADDLLQS